MSIIISSLRNREQNLVGRRGKNRAGIWILRAAAVIRPTYRSRSAANENWPLRNKCGQAGIKDSVGRAGGSDHMPQRFPLEISSVLQVPDGGLEQAKASVMVLGVLLEVVGQVPNPLGHQSHLDLRRTGVGLVGPVFLDDV